MPKLFWLAMILCLSAGPFLAGAVDLPDMGISADAALPPAKERELGEAFMRKLREQGKILDDPMVDAYLESLGYRLLAYSDNPQQPLRFFAVNDKEINAFAAPGGYIGVNTGLILYTRDENELASVAAHELAHVLQRHITRGAETAKQFSIPMLAAMIAAIAVGAHNPQLAQAAIASITAGSIQMQLNFTRAHEREADWVGMEILARAGFDPRGMPDFFGKMQESARLYGQSVPEFLRTHPVTVDRIADAQDRAARLHAPATEADADLPYHVMRARVLVLTHDEPAQLLATLQHALEQGKFLNEAALRYGIVLAGLAANPSPKWFEQLDWLDAHSKNNQAVFDVARAQLHLALHQTESALAQFAQTERLHPGNPLVSLQYAQALLQEDRPLEAKTLLTQLTAPRYPEIHRLLAQAHHDTGEETVAKLEMGRYYYAIGNTSLAVEQLRQIRKGGEGDYYLLSQADALLAGWEQELAEEKRIAKEANKEPNPGGGR